MKTAEDEFFEENEELFQTLTETMLSYLNTHDEKLLLLCVTLRGAVDWVMENTQILTPVELGKELRQRLDTLARKPGH